MVCYCLNVQFQGQKVKIKRFADLKPVLPYIVGCGAVSLGEQFSTFWMVVLPSALGQNSLEGI